MFIYVFVSTTYDRDLCQTLFFFCFNIWSDLFHPEIEDICHDFIDCFVCQQSLKKYIMAHSIIFNLFHYR